MISTRFIRRVGFAVGLTALALGALPMSAGADIVHNDDVIILFSLCVGNDCVNGESFGFDTLRLKENNLRVHFDDTSNSASFPRNDWRLIANDSANGGGEYFRIEDSTAGRAVFQVEAGAISNALYVDSSGDVGIGTATPVVELHAVDGNTPTLRLEQNGSSGFTPQTWDVAGNEAGFFIRDVTNGSTLPFRILPGAASQSLVIDGNDEVGIGAGTNPGAPLHVKRSNGTAQVLIEETSGTAANRSLLRLTNNGSTRFEIENTEAGTEWRFNNFGARGNFVFSKNVGAGAGNVMTVRGINDPSGSASVTIDGSLEADNVTFTSSRELKTGFEDIDEREILNRLLALEVSEWRFKDDAAKKRHVGPVAEDFSAAFDLGDGRRISLLDASGITIAAIQGLYAELEARSAELSEIREAKRLLEERVAALERLLTTQR